MEKFSFSIFQDERKMAAVQREEGAQGQSPLTKTFFLHSQRGLPTKKYKEWAAFIHTQRTKILALLTLKQLCLPALRGVVFRRQADALVDGDDERVVAEAVLHRRVQHPQTARRRHRNGDLGKLIELIRGHNWLINWVTCCVSRPSRPEDLLLAAAAATPPSPLGERRCSLVGVAWREPPPQSAVVSSLGGLDLP